MIDPPNRRKTVDRRPNPTRLVIPGLILVVALPGCSFERVDTLGTDPVDEGSVTLVDTLLALQAEERRVHLEYDHEAFVALMTDSTVQVNRGRVSTSSPEMLLQRFGAYFGNTTFVEWADIVPPRIEVGAGGASARVLVERRVRGISIDGEGRTIGHHTRFAWTEEWARTEPGGWKIVEVVSTDRPGDPAAVAHEIEPPVPATGSEADLAARVEAILARAGAALTVRRDLPHRGQPLGAPPVAPEAVPPTLDGLESLSFVAACHGPDGRFRTAVWSGGGPLDERPGVGHRMLQRSSDGEVADLEYSADRVTAAEPAARDRLYGFVAGHGQLLAALDARRAFGTPRLMERARFAGEEAEVLSFELADWRIDLFYSVERGLPLGTRLDIGPGAPPITTYWSDWERVDAGELDRAGIAGALLLPRRIAFAQGEEYFVYRIERIGVNRDRAALSLD